MTATKLVVVLSLISLRPAFSAERAAAPMPEATIAVAKAGNEFATDLYAQLSSDTTTNLCFSPYSISLALAMTDAGAAGRTESQIAKALHFPPAQANVHASYGALRKFLLSSEQESHFQLRVANRLWGQQGFCFQPKFLSVLKNDYGAELGQLNFQQPEAARKTINTWIAKQTDSKIQDLLAPGAVSSDTRMMLTNAIYFKARWLHEFSKTETVDAAFHPLDAEEVTVPTMHKIGYSNYRAADDVQVLEMYYGFGDLSMLILLPNKPDGLAALEKQLTEKNLRKWSSAMQSRIVNVDLPKFKVKSEFSLGAVLKTMGLTLPFSNKADFSRMSARQRLFISAVIHEAFIDVHEEGTEAAAALSIAVAPSAGDDEPEKPVTFRADHPFVFLIRDNRTQSILFLGRVMNPKG